MGDTATGSTVIAEGRVWACTFPALANQVREARRFLASILEGRPLADDALLCLSELVTNALQHSRSARPGGTVTVRVALRPRQLIVEVGDQGGPWRSCEHSDGQRGRGLHIVGQLADTWHITGDGITNRTVSFIMDLP
jgi:anti-sigma regulatory factor (Ser/Thr protein kinase)